MPTTSARTSRKSSAPRRRRCTNPMIAEGWAISAARGRVVRRVVGLLAGEVLDGPLRVGEALGADALLDLAGVEVRQVGDHQVGGLVGLGEVQPQQRGVDAAVDDDGAVLL